MKKFIFSLFIIILIIGLNSNKIVIPKESIRLRIIANSNDDNDQEIKMIVKNEVEKELVNILDKVYTKEEAVVSINNNISRIDNVVKNALSTNNYNVKYDINYGLNYFPEKKYNNITYKEGMYESLVVTIGEGKGYNWWCVLFPPFCLIEGEENDNIEYTWKIKEIIDRYF